MSLLLVMAGGTGGHVFPALAVANKLREQNVAIQWMGTDRGLEAKVVPAADIMLHTIDVAGIRGKSLLKKIVGPFGVIKSIFQALAILRKIQPQAVMGMGGYASGPGGIAAKLLGIPLIVHEQNAKPGSTNKILARVANRVLAGFPNVLPRSEFVGNPVRDEFYQQLPPAERFKQADNSQSFKILVLGGSLGARALNITVPKALALLSEVTDSSLPHRILVTHQTGARTFDEARAAYQELNRAQSEGDNNSSINCAINAQVVEFINDVAGELASADLVICRSGALTVAELAAVGAPSILVPFPYAVDDHQTANAQWMVERGGAQLLHESDLTTQSLCQAIVKYLKNRESLSRMAQAAWLREPYTATEKVAGICLEYLNV